MNFQALELSAANRPEFLPEESLLFVQDGVGLYEGCVYNVPRYDKELIFLSEARSNCLVIRVVMSISHLTESVMSITRSLDADR
jgi:hypothetical protein